MSVEKPKILRCPGCKKLILITSLDQHIKSGHAEGLYEPPVNPLTGKQPMLGLRWYKQIIVMAQEYTPGFIMWSIIVMGATAMLIIGRI